MNEAKIWLAPLLTHLEGRLHCKDARAVPSVEAAIFNQRLRTKSAHHSALCIPTLQAVGPNCDATL